MARQILVTGGAGYVGGHACKALAQAGYLPIALDNLTRGHSETVKWGPLLRGDVGDAGFLRQVFLDHEIEAVLHFAAYAFVGESMREPGKYFQNNSANTIQLLNAMIEAGVEHFVFSSTCATYGYPKKVPIPEDHPQHPINPYGESKLFVERALRWYESAFGLRSVALRYFNAAGADSDGEIGEDHDPETHLIPLAIQAALGQREYLEVYGADYATSDGTAVRDYIHVTDLAVAHVKALEYLLEAGESIALNLGTGAGHSVREVIAAIDRLSNRAVPRRDASRRPGDPPELVADARNATRVLGWKPHHSSLETIVETAWRWHTRSM